MGDLAVDTAVEGGRGRYTATLSADWNIWGPNGGYLAAVALRAAGAHAGLPRPASFHCHDLGVAAFARVDLEVQTLRGSRRAESLRVTMTQEGRPVLEALAWVVADGLTGMEHDATTAPDVPRADELVSVEDLLPPDAPPPHAFFGNLDQRPVRWIDDWEHRPAAEPLVESWYRLRPRATFDDPFVDAGRLAVLVDTFQWPAASRAHAAGSQPYIAPSLDLAVSFHHAAAAEPWLLVEARSPLASGGLVAGTARVWDGAGRLVASGGQQMLCRPIPT
jgi:acyl-CoA thioesterase